MTDLSRQSCFNHQRREAVVRCPDCRRYFCRECVTEHRHRMLCVQCLKQLTHGSDRGAKIWMRGFLILAQGAFGFVLLWYVFYLVGLTLLSIPHTFHEGTLWEANWWEQK